MSTTFKTNTTLPVVFPSPAVVSMEPGTGDGEGCCIGSGLEVVYPEKGKDGGAL